MTWIVASLVIVVLMFPKSVGRHAAEIVAAYRAALAQERSDG